MLTVRVGEHNFNYYYYYYYYYYDYDYDDYDYDYYYQCCHSTSSAPISECMSGFIVTIKL